MTAGAAAPEHWTEETLRSQVLQLRALGWGDGRIRMKLEPHGLTAEHLDSSPEEGQ